MELSKNDIVENARKFEKRWAKAKKESAESQSFYNDFFDVFGLRRDSVAQYEVNVAKQNDNTGEIDVLWKGVFLAEQKSKGKDLQEAYKQANEYVVGLPKTDKPRYVMVCDFERFELYDKELDEHYSFTLEDFHKNIDLFGFISGYQEKVYRDTEQANIRASELMGKLYDTLKKDGYATHDLEKFLVRILFCLFADDTEIFNKDSFKKFIIEYTHVEGHDVGAMLLQMFTVLNTSESERENVAEIFYEFPYINGDLFDGLIGFPTFNKSMRDALIECSNFDWSNISPAIFGSLFQSVSDKERRREKGEHYTSEKNILKTIRPLFLDDLQEEFKEVRNYKKKLENFHQKLAKLKFLDPACGCGNFLVVTYREIRLLELEVIKILYPKPQQVLDISMLDHLLLVNVDNFYGIELEEFPAKIAEVALWLVDHQMNELVSVYFGRNYARIPLKTKANIINDNALRIDWKEVIPPSELSYIFGNPPFIGSQLRTNEQTEDLEIIFSHLKTKYKELDYVSAWYIKSAEYMACNENIRSALVSTNSITQGKQVGILWKILLQTFGVKIHFAHRTFAWNNEARGKAAVHCVIIGFGLTEEKNKYIFEYENIKGDANKIIVNKINSYLVEGDNIFLDDRSKPISKVPNIDFGNMPNDGGNLLLSDEEKNILVQQEPISEKYIKPLISAREYLNGKKRWCLWLVDLAPSDLKNMPMVKRRIENVKELRVQSSRKETKALADYPTLFGEIRQPKSKYILIPRVSSENRRYIPIGFFDKKNIVSDTCLAIPNVTLYHFGVLTSSMHMVWVRTVCGRLKSDYRYSNKIVYNNYPWVKNPTDEQIKKVEESAQKVLDAREDFPDASLADLYDPLTMPPKLLKAHQELDKAVEKSYGRTFKTDRERIEFLFDLYKECISKK